MFGIKIKKFIDAINKRNINVNRFLFWSIFIYSCENFSTLAEINITIDEYMTLLHSIINCILIVFEKKHNFSFYNVYIIVYG